jgi:adenylosuccinate synthase
MLKSYLPRGQASRVASIFRCHNVMDGWTKERYDSTNYAEQQCDVCGYLGRVERTWVIKVAIMSVRGVVSSKPEQADDGPDASLLPHPR